VCPARRLLPFGVREKLGRRFLVVRLSAEIESKIGTIQYRKGKELFRLLVQTRKTSEIAQLKSEAVELKKTSSPN
jgi:hypothetical protein